jgi:hypothetical protein
VPLFPPAKEVTVPGTVRPPLELKDVQRLVADIGSPKFAIRDKADKELSATIDRAEPQVRKFLKEPLTLETRRRLERILAVHDANRAGWPELDAEELQSLRAIEALELSGFIEARLLIEELSRGAEGVRLTRHAKAAAERMQYAGMRMGKRI